MLGVPVNCFGRVERQTGKPDDKSLDACLEITPMANNHCVQHITRGFGDVSLFAPFPGSLLEKRGDTSVLSLPHKGLYAHSVCTFLLRCLPHTECRLGVRQWTHAPRCGCTGIFNHHSILSWVMASITKLQIRWIAVEFMALKKRHSRVTGKFSSDFLWTIKLIRLISIFWKC